MLTGVEIVMMQDFAANYRIISSEEEIFVSTKYQTYWWKWTRAVYVEERCDFLPFPPSSSAITAKFWKLLCSRNGRHIYSARRPDITSNISGASLVISRRNWSLNCPYPTTQPSINDQPSWFLTCEVRWSCLAVQTPAFPWGVFNPALFRGPKQALVVKLF